MARVLLNLASDLNIRLRQNHCVFRLAVRLINALILKIGHCAVNDHLRSATGGIRERDSILDLILMTLNAAENQDGDNVGTLLGNPVATMLEVEPWLERRLRRKN